MVRYPLHDSAFNGNVFSASHENHGSVTPDCVQRTQNVKSDRLGTALAGMVVTMSAKSRYTSITSSERIVPPKKLVARAGGRDALTSAVSVV